MENDGGPAYPNDSDEMKCPTCDGTATKDDRCSECGVEGVIYKDYLGMSFRDAAFPRQLDGRIDFSDPEDWADQCSLAWNAAQVATDTRQRRLDDEQAG